ncbi:MAG: SDR family NAD(P)-dependent oxidoreductase [Candidatus Avelusimicrobium sp.]
MKFIGKTVLITGGAGGIGSDCAEKFAKEGAKVAVVDLNEALACAVCAEITASGGIAKQFVADVTDNAQVEECVENVVKEFGGVDILVNVAGGSARKRRAYFYEQDVEVFRNNIEVNLFSAFYFARKCAPYMIEKGWGRIINTASVVGLNGHVKHAEYSAAKGGVIAMTKSMAKEVGRFGITVNTVCPGIIPTSNSVGEKSNVDLSHTNYLGITPSAADISNAILYLASEEARFITGLDLVVDGGRHLATRGTEE